MTKQQGKDYHNLEVTARFLKESINQYKLELGLVLDELQNFHKEYEELGTFKTLLATLHLNMRRTVPLIRNARWVTACNTPLDKWRHLDSSVVDKLRSKKKTPNFDDMQGGVSYNDL